MTLTVDIHLATHITQANYDPPDKEYSLDADGHFIIYDIDEEDTPYSSNRTIFARTESDESKLWLAQPANKVKKTWYNHSQNRT